VQHGLEAVGLRLLTACARGLPPRLALASGRALGRLALGLRIRQRVCMSNLAIAFPGAEHAAERRRVARSAYEHLGVVVFEFLGLARLRREELQRRLEVVGVEQLQASLARGQGVILATGHYGNWEILSAGLVAHGFPVSVVVQRLHNPAAEAIVHSARDALGERSIERGMGLRRVRVELQSNRILGILCDQDGKKRGVFVPFFGRSTSTPKGAAQMSRRWGIPFHPAFGQRLADGRHRLVVHPAVDVPAHVPEDQAVQQMMARFNTLLEATIRTDPGQYFWLHRRWKTPEPASSAT